MMNCSSWLFVVFEEPMGPPRNLNEPARGGMIQKIYTGVVPAAFLALQLRGITGPAKEPLKERATRVDWAVEAAGIEPAGQCETSSRIAPIPRNFPE
jgi:hypothetical protein